MDNASPGSKTTDQDIAMDPSFRPSRWKGRLMFWIVFSVAMHGIGGLVLWQSQAARDFLFSSFNSKPPQIESIEQLARSRAIFDLRTRRRMVEATTRLLKVSRDVGRRRDKEWEAIGQRAAANPFYQAMYTDGLPPLYISSTAGEVTVLDIPGLHNHAGDLEIQVVRLYQHYRAASLSLTTIIDQKDGHQVPQPFSVSLSLNEMEIPTRSPLNLELLNASNEALFAIKSQAHRPASASTPEIVARLDGFGLWRAEAERALQLTEVMANNAERILEQVNGSSATALGGPVSLAPGGGPGDIYKEDNDYRGESLNPIDAEMSDLTSGSQKNAIMSYGKNPSSRSDDPNARQAKNLVIDTWWGIGPFAYIGNERADSLHHRYPPEIGVDLDAVYIGKGGRKLQWKYMPFFNQARQEPQHVEKHSVYYFYTQFWSDADQEVFANIASDDFGALWLNDSEKPVYLSGESARPWVILDPRQYKKLKLKKGTNRMLMKLDNNGGTTGMTVIFQLR